MSSYETWKLLKRELAEAERWASLLGKKSNATAPHVGTISGTSGSLCIHYQPSDGATNYHDSPKQFNAHLADVMKADALPLIEKTLAIMRAKVSAALVACEGEIATMAREIEFAKAESK